jgi:hypothetical protein
VPRGDSRRLRASDLALWLAALGGIAQLCATRFVLVATPDATAAYRVALGRDPARLALANADALPLAIAAASSALGPVPAYLVNALFLALAALVAGALARSLVETPERRVAGASALASWLTLLAVGRSSVVELANPYPDPLRVCVLGALLSALRARGRISRAALAGLLALGLSLAFVLRSRASDAVAAFWIASTGAPLAGALLALGLRKLLARAPESLRARLSATALGIAWLVSALALADARARDWVAPGESGRELERPGVAELAALRGAIDAAVPPGARIAAAEPLAALLRVFGEREVLALDPATAARAPGETWTRRVSALALARGDRVVAAVSAAGETRDPAEQLLAGEFDLAPIRALSSDELRLGRWLAGRERLEFARLLPWTQHTSATSLHLAEAGDAWLRADVGRLSQHPRERAELWLDAARLGRVRSDFENAWFAANLAAGAHRVELRSDAPVPAQLRASLRPAHQGLDLAPGDREQALALRARRGTHAQGSSVAQRLLVPTPDPARAAFLIELDLSAAGDPARAAVQLLSLSFGGRALPGGPLGAGELNAAGERILSLALSLAGDELPGEDSELSVELRAPDASPPAEARIERVRVQRVPLRDPSLIELGRRDRAFLLEGFGAKAELGSLRARSVESRARTLVCFPRGVPRAWLEVDFIASRGSEDALRLRWDGDPLPLAERESQRVDLGDGRGALLLRARSALDADQLAHPIHQLEIEAPLDSAGARAPLLLHRVRVATERSALDAPTAARGD